MITRRSFLSLLGGGALVTVVAPDLLLPEAEPVRRFWQVGRNAPVRSLYDGEALFSSGASLAQALNEMKRYPLTFDTASMRDWLRAESSAAFDAGRFQLRIMGDVPAMRAWLGPLSNQRKHITEDA